MLVKPQNPQELLACLRKKRLVLYGFGGTGASIARWCDEHKIDYIFADQDAVNKRDGIDKIIIAPEVLAEEYSDANIVISSITYYDEIKKKLLSLGIDRDHILSYQLFLPERVTWKDLEHSTAWGTHMGRVKQIADWIPQDARSVADYGAGRLSLKQFLSSATVYYPIDYKKRSGETILCDFDQDELPMLDTAVSVCTATLVFVSRAEKLMEHLCRYTAERMILSYVTLEKFPNKAGRRASGYVNDFSQEQFLTMLSTCGFRLEAAMPDPANNIDTLYLFVKK